MKSTQAPWWLTALLGAVVLCFAVAVTPNARRDAQETERLQRDGLHLQGRVVGHRLQDLGTGPKKKQAHVATVEYTVNQTAYTVELAGEGALPERLPDGTLVDVVYLRDQPEIAAARANGAETGRSSLAGLAIPYGMALVLLGLAFFTWRRRRRG